MGGGVEGRTFQAHADFRTNLYSYTGGLMVCCQSANNAADLAMPPSRPKNSPCPVPHLKLFPRPPHPRRCCSILSALQALLSKGYVTCTRTRSVSPQTCGASHSSLGRAAFRPSRRPNHAYESSLSPAWALLLSACSFCSVMCGAHACWPPHATMQRSHKHSQALQARLAR